MASLGPLLLLEALRALGARDPTVLGPTEDVPIEATDVRYIRARNPETVIRGRPWVPHPRVATVQAGTRLVVRGIVPSRDDAGCRGRPWYAVFPLGFVCSEHASPTERAPSLTPAIAVEPGDRLPYDYVLVRDEEAPLYADRDALREGIVDRTLHKGMSLVAERTVTEFDERYIQTAAGALVPRDAVGWMGQGSEWRGVWIVDVTAEGPLFAWTSKRGVVTLAEPSRNAAKRAKVPGRKRVPLLRRQGEYWEIDSGQWVHASDLNEVNVIRPPEGVLEDDHIVAGDDRWVDVDVGEQVLVAYRGTTPVFATMVSSGRRSPTPLGNYPVWAKVGSIDMSNQDYEDHPYLVEGVPWVLLFQGHNALHGAYWHDDFGRRKSHGCVNLAPADAQWMFEWLGLSLPEGWTGFLPPDLHHSPVVHVRDSSDPGSFTQERPWGPPDKEAEREKLEEALERRAIADALTPEPLPAITDIDSAAAFFSRSGPPTPPPTSRP